MRKGIIVAAAAVVAIAGGLLASVSLWEQETASGLAIEEVVPPAALYWIEVRDASELWGQMRGTDSWRELRDSPLAAKFLADEETRTFLDALAEVSDKTGYELDETNVLKFVGDEVGLAVYAADDEFEFLAVSRLDTTALARDLLTGEADWRALQDEIDRRVELSGCEVTTQQVGEYTLATARKDDVEFHVTMMQDVLVVSETEERARAAIALRVAEGEGSLGRDPEFVRDREGLPENVATSDWIHVRRIRQERERIAAAAVARSEADGGDLSPQDASELLSILDVVEAPAFGRALVLPGGDLYGLSWTYTRDDTELFADDAHPDLRSVFPEETAVYFEVTDAGRLAEAWRGSAVEEALADSWIVEYFEKLTGAPEDLSDLLDRPEVPDVSDEDVEMATDAFVRRFGWNLLRRGVTSTLGTEAACGVTVAPDASEPVMLVAVRLATDGRWLERFARAGLRIARAEGGESVDVAAHAGREIVGGGDRPGAPEMYWALVGDLWLFSNEVDALKAAMDRAESPTGTDPLAGVETPLSGSPDVFFRGVVRAAPFTGFIEENMPDGELMAGPFGLGQYDFAALELAIPDDFGHIELAMTLRYTDLDEWKPLALYHAAPAVRPATLDALPEETFLFAAINADLTLWADMVETMVAEFDGSTDFDEAMARADEVVGMSFRDELLPAFGTESSFGAVLSTEPVSDEIPAIPGLVHAIGTRDPETVSAALENVVPHLKEAIEPPPGEPGARVLRSTIDGRDVVRISDPDFPVEPALALVDGTLFIVADVSLLQDIAAVRGGVATSMARGATQARVEATGLPMDAHTLLRVDWNATVDQLQAYTEAMAAPFVSHDAVPFPEFPEDGDTDEWNRRMEAYTAARKEAAAEKANEFRQALDSTRFVDFLISTSKVEGNTITSRTILGFK